MRSECEENRHTTKGGSPDARPDSAAVGVGADREPSLAWSRTPSASRPGARSPENLARQATPRELSEKYAVAQATGAAEMTEVTAS